MMQTRIGPDVATVYAIFARAAAGSRLGHVELLVDAAGLLRARWAGVPAPGVDRDAEILEAVQRLPETSAMPATMHHSQ